MREAIPMSTQTKTVTIDGHRFDVVAEAQGSGGWRAEVVNASKTAYAFDPVFGSAADALAHAEDELMSSDPATFLG
jgi:hypothetical protein